MIAYDRHAVIRSFPSLELIESGNGRTHFVLGPSLVTKAVVEGVDRFAWAPLTFCGLSPWARWLRLSHCGDPICRTCLTRWRRLLDLFARLDAESHRPPSRKETNQ